MPVTVGNPLGGLKDALLSYQARHKKRITLEAVLLRGVNTGGRHAELIRDFARGLDVIINLIPWNSVEGLRLDGLQLRAPAKTECAAFAASLKALGLKTEFRREKGRSASAACGQLGIAI
jgi:23S rRNA (adenine2503-C2)-methyltransferase